MLVEGSQKRGGSKKRESDFDLIDKIHRGDKLAFSKLVVRHKDKLGLFVQRMTRDAQMTEDILQDAFIKAFTKISGFQRRSSFKSWLYRIAINTTKNRLRSRRRNAISLDKIQLSVNSIVENVIYKTSLNELLNGEIDKLPVKQKLVLKLRIFDDMSFKDIAKYMNSPYDTAKANYRHALLKIKKWIKANELYDDWKDLNEMKSRVNQSYLDVSNF